MTLGKKFTANSFIKLKGDIELYILEDVTELKRLIYSDSPNIKVKIAAFYPRILVIAKKDIKYYEKVKK